MAFTEYQERNKTLRQMGFPTYRAYLESDEWRRIREKVLRTQKHRCHVCRGTAVLVHHTNYDRKVLEGKRVRPLVALCADCYRRGEFVPSGRKTELKEANRRLGLWGVGRKRNPHPHSQTKKQRKKFARKRREERLETLIGLRNT